MALSTRRRSTQKAPEIKFLSNLTWEKGLQTDRDADRTTLDGLKTSENSILNRTGTVSPRPGLRPYGIQPVGTVFGAIYEYVRLDTSVTPNLPETWLIWAENRSGTGKIYTAKDGGTAIEVTGSTYDITGNPRYEQIAGKVLITSQLNNLSYMDVQTQTITVMTALSQPGSGPTAVATGISGTNATLRYRYAAANLGETAASPAGTVGVTKVREMWTGTTEYVTITGNRITGAQRYNIYVGDQAGFEYFLDSVSDPGSGSTWTYVDTGSIAEATTRIAPVGDSTAGPKVARATNIKGQPFLVGDQENLGRVWFGGTGESALDFSSYNGGGWVEPNKGGKDFPVKVVPFRDGKGTPMATVLSKGTNGAGKRYLMSAATTTVGSTVISYMSVQEDNGQDGTDSPDGVLLHNDSIVYPSRNGFKTSKTLPNLQNLVSTVGISPSISTDVENLSATYMDKAVGLVSDDVLYWSLPYSSTENNQIWVYDTRQRNGAWMRPWHISADWMWQYADNTDGKTKFLMLVDNKFMQVDAAMATNDNGVAFQGNIGSGDWKFNEDGTMWANVIDITFVFLRQEGQINLSGGVMTEDGLVPFGDSMSTPANQSVPAWGRNGWGVSGWSTLTALGSVITSGKPKRTWTIEIDEECNSINWNVNWSVAGVKFQLSEVIVRYVPIGYKETDNV